MLQLYSELPLLKPSALAGGRVRNMNKGCCVPEVRFYLRKHFSGIFQDGVLHSSPFITDTASVRLVSQRFGDWGRMMGEAPEEFSVT